MNRYRVIALDGSPKSGKTELAKRIIVSLKAKGYNPVVIESSNSFFNLCDLYSNNNSSDACYSSRPYFMKDCCVSVKNHYTGPNMYKDCFFSMPINQYLDMLFKKITCSTYNNNSIKGSTEFILQSLFALYYQNISAAETALAIDKNAVIILDGSLYETLVWYAIYSKKSNDIQKYVLNMINKIRYQFPSVFNNMLYVLTHTEPLQIYDRTKFDCKAFSEYQTIYQQLTKEKTDIDIKSQVQIGISYTNDIFQQTRDIVRTEHIDAITISGNYAEEITKNSSKIISMFSN